MTKAAAIAEVIRERLLHWASVAQGHRPVVALSGGVDSCSIVAAFMELHMDPICVSYTPETHESTDFQMAKATAEKCGLEFHELRLSMDPDYLDACMRAVIGFGYHSKVQVESLIPLYAIIQMVADEDLGNVLYTGDQSDGYFCLGQFSATTWNNAHGYPAAEKATKDTDPTRIDGIRKAYYEKDKSCSGAIREIAAARGLSACFPYRDLEIFAAFTGSVWMDVNKPRIKEPIKIAFEDWFHNEAVLTRKVNVNLHKGDSLFGNTFAELMLARYPQFNSARGLYGAVYRGEV